MLAWRRRYWWLRAGKWAVQKPSYVAEAGMNQRDLGIRGQMGITEGLERTGSWHGRTFWSIREKYIGFSFQKQQQATVSVGDLHLLWLFVERWQKKAVCSEAKIMEHNYEFSSIFFFLCSRVYYYRSSLKNSKQFSLKKKKKVFLGKKNDQEEKQKHFFTFENLQKQGKKYPNPES